MRVYSLVIKLQHLVINFLLSSIIDINVSFFQIPKMTHSKITWK